MKSLQQCVDERMSIRKYKDKDITRKILTQLVLNASKAPSGSNIQPWEFVIVDDPTLLSKLTNYAPGIISLPRQSLLCV